MTRQTRANLLGVFAIVAVVLAAYYPVLKNGFIWDDDRYIETNLQLRTLDGLKRIWLEPLSAEPQYYPLTHTSLWIEYHLWGLHPQGYHVDNVLLHLCSAIVLWRILIGLRVPGALAVALIFAVHPMQVESVAWATERKNILSGLLYLLSLGSYLRWDRKRAAIGWYAISLLLFVAALLSKSVTATLPAVILLLCWWKRGKIRLADVWPVVPMFLAGAAMGSLTGWMEKHVVGAIGPKFDFLTPIDRCCIAGRAIWFYLEKLFWPLKLTFIYPHWQIDPSRRAWLLLFPLATIGAVAACWLLRHRIGRGPATAALFFIGTLVPALGFVNVFPMQYSYVADHFQYLACIGPIALVVAVISARWKSAAAILFSIAIVAMCVASNVRTRAFFDRRTLWADTLAKNPGSAMAHNNYGIALMHAGDLNDARTQFQMAMELQPDSADWIGLGQSFAIQGDYLTALDMYRRALNTVPPSTEPVYQHLRAGREFQVGTAYQGLAEHTTDNPTLAQEYRDAAARAYQQATDLFPEYEDPRLNLALMLADEHRYSQAIDQCRIVLQEDPDSVSAHKNLGAVFYMRGQLGSAQAEYQQVLKLDPKNADALASLGGILAQNGRIDEGLTMIRKALAIDASNAIARRNLAAALKLAP